MVLLLYTPVQVYPSTRGGCRSRVQIGAGQAGSIALGNIKQQRRSSCRRMKTVHHD